MTAGWGCADDVDFFVDRLQGSSKAFDGDRVGPVGHFELEGDVGGGRQLRTSLSDRGIVMPPKYFQLRRNGGGNWRVADCLLWGDDENV